MRVLYGGLSHGQHSLSHPKLGFGDHISRILNQCNISLTDLEQAASDRDMWSNGLEALAILSEQAAEERRSRRHSASRQVHKGPACPQCGHVCISEFGLRSHLPSHQTRSPHPT